MCGKEDKSHSRPCEDREKEWTIKWIFLTLSLKLLRRHLIMVRISKQAEKRSLSPKKRKAPTSPIQHHAQTAGYKEHPNAISGEVAQSCFIPKIR